MQGLFVQCTLACLLRRLSSPSWRTTISTLCDSPWHRYYLYTFFILLSSVCLQRVFMILYVKKGLRYDIQVLQSPLKLSPFTQTSSVFLFFFCLRLSVCTEHECLLCNFECAVHDSFFTVYTLLHPCQPVSYRQSCSLRRLRYSHNLFASLRGCNYHEGVAVWQRCWTSVHDVTFCYVSFWICFTSCYVALSLSRFLCFFLLRWTGCLCTRFIAPRICTYPSQHYVTLVLGKESDMFSLYSSWSVAINFVYWEVSYVLHRFPPCKKFGNMCRTCLHTQMLS